MSNMTNAQTNSHNNGSGVASIYVTLTGIPLHINIDWPFHRSTSGADFYVVHADLKLADGSGLHAPVAVNLSSTVKEVLPSLEKEATEGPVINALRKEVDRKQVEFLKSGKLVPVHFSSRHYDFRRNRWAFGAKSEDEITQLLLRKAYWQTKGNQDKVWMADPIDALYVDATPQHLLELAKGLSTKKLIHLNGEWATATEQMLKHAAGFEEDLKQALAELEKKHAFERG
ncbi:MAG TPA: hypothetical protein VKW78_12050 [Terriglobales bacterium]|nr:hypothetical protein [Terriglobales bacterium]